MGIDAADVTSWVGAGTSVVSITLATAAYRKSGPRVSVAASPDGFMGSRGLVAGSSLSLFVSVSNLGAIAVRVARVELALLVSRERLAEHHQLPGGGVQIELESAWNPASKILAGGSPARHAPYGGLRPVRVPFGRSSAWLRFRLGLTFPEEVKATIAPFDGFSFDAPVPWALAEVAEWLRLEARLASGRTARSSWWRNDIEQIGALKSSTEDGPSLAKAVGRVSRAISSRRAGEAGRQDEGHRPG